MNLFESFAYRQDTLVAPSLSVIVLLALGALALFCGRIFFRWDRR